MPNSRPRRATLCANTPYKPIPASSVARPAKAEESVVTTRNGAALAFHLIVHRPQALDRQRGVERVDGSHDRGKQSSPWVTERT